MLRLLALAAMLLASTTHADNKFADCILDNMADVQNDPAAYAIMKLCLDRYPSGFNEMDKRTGFFARYSSGAACIAAKGKAAAGTVAPQRIRAACYLMYEPPAPGMFDDLIKK